MRTYISTLALVALIFQGCSEGGGRRVNGKRCKIDADPVPMVLTPGQKRTDINSASVPPGSYTYNGAELYYVDESDFRVHVIDSLQEGTFKTSTDCVRNSKNSFQPIAVDGLESMNVDANGKVLNGQALTLAFGSEASGKLLAKVEKDPSKKVNAPSSIYQGKASDYFFMSTDGNTTDYEIRSTGTINGTGHYFMTVRYTRKAP